MKGHRLFLNCCFKFCQRSFWAGSFVCFLIHFLTLFIFRGMPPLPIVTPPCGQARGAQGTGTHRATLPSARRRGGGGGGWSKRQLDFSTWPISAPRAGPSSSAHRGAVTFPICFHSSRVFLCTATSLNKIGNQYRAKLTISL